MSIRYMTKVWDAGPEDRTETMVLLALADHANDDGRCYPSISHLADKTRLSRQGLCNALDRLEDDGWISRERGGGRGNPTHYTLQDQRFGASPKQSSQVDGKNDVNSQADTVNSQADQDKQSTSLDGNRQEPSKNRQSRAPARDEVGEMFDALVDAARNVRDGLTQRMESKLMRAAQTLAGEYDPVTAANCLREDLSGAGGKWNAQVFADSVMPEYERSLGDGTATSEPPQSVSPSYMEIQQ